MLYTISNDHLTLSAETRGAELRSVRKTSDGLEYLWQGSDASWSGRAPLLFPVIGRLKGGSYSHGGRTFGMGIHGFARESEFTAASRSEGELSFFLRDSDRSRASWPFEFELEIRYALHGATIRKEHILRNAGEAELLYELGGHEGYNLPLFPGESMRDYYIQFEGEEVLSCRCLDADIFITRELRTLALDGGRLLLDMGLFDNDALILEGLAERRVTIANSRNDERLRVSFPDFEYLGIWTMAGRRDSGFICIEPWSALPDCSFLDDRLEHKLGIRKLAPGESESLRYTMEFGEL
jgi:galactose mutarotase-like enzyme